MRVPKRQGGEFTYIVPDPKITQAKYDALAAELKSLKSRHLPAIMEVKRLAEMGDFSENAAYQIAKGRLRGLNRRLEELENQLKHAVIISPAVGNSRVQLGHFVTVLIDGRPAIYQILGSAEIDVEHNIISHNSPIGSALIGRATGETVTVELARGLVDCKIIKIESDRAV